MVPSKEVDAFWHAHILDTMKYAEDCEEIFGYFLHHFPYLGLRGGEDAARQEQADQETQRLYQQEFGEPMHAGAAFCSVATKKDAAFCSVATKKDAAFCSVATKKDAAFCSIATKKGAAFCSVATKKTAAFCSVATKKDTAFCSVTIKGQRAFCSVARPQGNLETRPALALAA